MNVDDKRAKGYSRPMTAEEHRQFARGMRKAISDKGPLMLEDVLRQFGQSISAENVDRATGEAQRREAERAELRAKHDAKVARRIERERRTRDGQSKPSST